LKRVCLILAGGAGTRLRPLSSDENPKQFLRLFDGQSLLEKTAARARELDALYISTNDTYAVKCAEHVPEATILTEPDRRNTAPAIALCMQEIERREGECVVSVLASDHYIADEAVFRRTLERAYSFAQRNEFLVTIGIAPTEPNTGYGYLELGEPIGDGFVRVRRFTEKPSRDVAESFLRAGNYLWNASMFVWCTDVFRRDLESHAPEIAQVTRENYASMPSISIDYALMEKSDRVAAIRGDFGWSDVGSFEALRRAGVDVDRLLNR
jgi:mannose-1-phosphate guanylyltransferase/mannose-6-phosphate isomerase